MTTDDPGDDPLIEQVIERAIEPYLGILPPGKIEELKKTMRFGLSTHPKAQDLLRRLRLQQPVPVKRSGTRTTAGDNEDEAEAGELGGGRPR